MQLDTPVYPDEVMALLRIRHSNTLRLKIKSGAIPPPDVRISARLRYWHRKTLVAAGLLPAEQGTPA